jgi:YD repeat-containing protein
MRNVQDYEVIICGAGVGGLALAIALGRQGRRVLVVEKHQAETLVHRGELLQPRTLEILEQWEVLAELQARGSLPIVAMEARTAQGVYLGELNYEQLPEHYNYGLAQYYHAIKAALYAVARNLAEIRYGTHVHHLERDAWGKVIGVHITQGNRQEILTAALVVGADGRTSQIRREIGIPERMFEYPHQLMGFDLVDVPELAPRMCAFLSKDGVRVLYPMPGKHARLYIQIQRGEFARIKQRGMTAWQKELFTTTPGLRQIAPYLPADFSTAQLQGAWSYSARHWSRTGVALLGDAAHYVHPTAGQGMNSAIIDAWSLSQTLESAAQGGAFTPDALAQALASYENRRLEFQVVSILCHRLALFCTATETYRRALTRWSLHINRHNRFLQYRVMRNVAGYSPRVLSLSERLRQYVALPPVLSPSIERHAGN